MLQFGLQTIISRNSLTVLRSTLILSVALISLLKSVAVAAGALDGVWGYRNEGGYFYLQLSPDNSCFVEVGGPVDGHAGACLYALNNGNGEIIAFKVGGRLQSSPEIIRFIYDPQRDSITFPPSNVELVRFPWKKGGREDLPR